MMSLLWVQNASGLIRSLYFIKSRSLHLYPGLLVMKELYWLQEEQEMCADRIAKFMK